MKSRQRVLCAVNHQVPDRMPIDLGMNTSTGISAFAYWNLRKYLGMELDSVEIHDCVQILARVEEDILQKFHCDCILLKPHPKKTRLWGPKGDYLFRVPEYFRPQKQPNGDWNIRFNGQFMRMPESSYFFDGDWISFENMWEDALLTEYAREAERIYKETDYFTMMKAGYPFFHADLDYFCKMILEPEEVAEENRERLKLELQNAGKLIRNFAGNLQAICLTGDLGAQNGPLCRPDDFWELVVPYLKQYCDFIHRNSDFKIFFHSCGAIEPFLEAFIECGVDMINPVQISAAGMDPQRLKENYGDRITFWGGGCNTQEVLGQKTPEEVSEHVKDLVAIWKPGGGYVFNPVHNVMADVPPENVVSAYEAAYRNSFYGC